MTDNTSNNNDFSCSLIIPTRDNYAYLKSCIDSILESSNNEKLDIIIIDNRSEEKATLNYLDSLRRTKNFQVLSWPHPFNYSAINNFAAKAAKSEVLCFLNNDVVITDKEWLSKTLPLVKRQDVGAVGCVLLYPDSTIQHAGIALDEQSIAKHIALNEESKFLENHGISDPFAVDCSTAAFLLTKRELFFKLGGFNEAKLSIAYNDVDLCLRMSEKGLPILIHPGVKLIHHESMTRESDDLPSNRPRAVNEFNYTKYRWRHRLVGKRYERGIPRSIKKLVSESLGELDTMILMATSLLYEDQEIDEKDILSTVAPPRNLNDAHSAKNYASNWEQRYNDLSIEHSALEAHTKRLKIAHQQIEKSLFWRVTWPVRLFRDKSYIALTHLKTIFKRASSNPMAVEDQSEDGNTLNERDSKGQHDVEAQSCLAHHFRNKRKIRFPTSEHPLVSIILIFYNQAHLSLLCLNSILENADVNYELIIVDNKSTDSTSNLLQSLENVVIVENKSNLGFVKAVNLGASRASGKYLLLLNNDATLEPRTLSSAIATFEMDQKIGAVGGKIKLLDGTLQEAGSIIWDDGACLGYGRNSNPESPEFNFVRDVDYCSGAFLLTSVELFRDLDGFDESFAPAYYEESDFCVRLKQKGFRIVYDPRAEITHYEFASIGGMENAHFLQLEHQKLFCSKHRNYLRTRLKNKSFNIFKARIANQYPNLLMIDDRVPHPSLGAGYPRCNDILSELSKMPINVSFYPLLFPDDTWAEIQSTLPGNIEVIREKGKKALLDFLLERVEHYQFILISRIHNMEFFRQIISGKSELFEGVDIIYDAEALTAHREIMRRSLTLKPLTPEEESELIRNEVEQTKIARSVIAVSHREAKTFLNNGVNNVHVLGHTIKATPGENLFTERKGFLFVGALRDDGSPNVDSLLWFIINALPLIESQIPEAKLYVIGDNSAPSLTMVSKANVLFEGKSDNLQEIYNNCRVFIAPTRFAAGIPHKIHEASSNGVPCVSTSLLAEQLEWSPEQELLVGDTGIQFASQCVRLYQDAKLWKKIRASSLNAVQRDCSKNKFKGTLETLLLKKSR